MRPAPFTVLRPRSLDEGLAALAGHADARAIAGGMSLAPMMRLRLARPELLVDVTVLDELRGVAVGDAGVRLGALTTPHDLRRDERLQAPAWRALPEAAGHVGHYPIQLRGTVGGSLSHADPAAELPVVAAAYDAMVEIRSADRAREAGIDEFVVGPYQASLEPGELVVGVRLPAPPAGARSGFREIARRPGDFAVVAAAAVVAAGFIRIALAKLDGRARRCPAAEAAFGAGPGAAADAAAEAMSGPLERHLVRGLVGELLEELT